MGTGVVLVLGYTGQADPGLGVDPLDETRAIETDPWALATPDVRSAQVGLGVRHDHRTETPLS